MARTTLLGILNITDDSFSDGGRYLDPAAALTRADELCAAGADIVDLGAASSKPNAQPVDTATEIARLAPVVAHLRERAALVSVDSFNPDVQRWALRQGVGWLNDVRGFPEPGLYPDLAAHPKVRLIVMHSVGGSGPAPKVHVPPEEILDRISRFFDSRLDALVRAGIARERVVLDPGMGFFLGTANEASLLVLRNLPRLKERFGLPVLISVSRKSFLRQLAGAELRQAGAPTLAAELFAAQQGADLIRTHEPGALRFALNVWRELAGEH